VEILSVQKRQRAMGIAYIGCNGSFSYKGFEESGLKINAFHVWFSWVVEEEDAGLLQHLKNEDDGIKEGRFEFGIMVDREFFWGRVVNPDLIECVVHRPDMQGNLKS
jgi:hypothetical protein